jgi:rhamnosyltransferase
MNKVIKMILNVAGVVVLYNPDDSVIENINSYIKHVEKLYAIDNSEIVNHAFVSLLKNNSKIEYISNNANLGIAKALNIGAYKAMAEGFTWLLTMDQDSKATENMLPKLVEFIKRSKTENIGIVSPYHDIEMGPPRGVGEYELALSVMTSGNLLNLAAFEKVGSFDESFFIDYVDIEYCLRLNKKGYKVVILNNVDLVHNLGNISKINSGFLKFKTSNHNAIRRYYITRNRFYVRDLYINVYTDFIKNDISGFYKETIKIILGEKQKLAKLKNIIKGYLDYKNGVTGKK